MLIDVDIDECGADEFVCDVNANCSNTDGSYNCICKPGFTGNGTSCTGRCTIEDLQIPGRNLFRVFMNIYNRGQLHGSFCLQKRWHSYFNLLKKYKPSP